jgi:hypothetical protein
MLPFFLLFFCSLWPPIEDGKIFFPSKAKNARRLHCFPATFNHFSCAHILPLPYTFILRPQMNIFLRLVLSLYVCGWAIVELFEYIFYYVCVSVYIYTQRKRTFTLLHEKNPFLSGTLDSQASKVSRFPLAMPHHLVSCAFLLCLSLETICVCVCLYILQNYKKYRFLYLAGFPHHLPGIPSSQAAHLTGTPDWRVLNNRPFPPTQYFHHHPHFTAHNMLTAAIDRSFTDGSK